MLWQRDQEEQTVVPEISWLVDKSPVLQFSEWNNVHFCLCEDVGSKEVDRKVFLAGTMRVSSAICLTSGAASLALPPANAVMMDSIPGKCEYTLPNASRYLEYMLSPLSLHREMMIVIGPNDCAIEALNSGGKVMPSRSTWC